MPQATINTARAIPRRTPSHPITHDLIAMGVPMEDGTTWPPVTYRAFEIWPGNLEATARQLRQGDLLRDGICPLVITNFSLSARQLSSLPPSVPWIRRVRAGNTQLEEIREVLVEPLESRGLICVDFMDYAAALTFGGEIRLFRAHATDLAAAGDRVRSEVRAYGRRGHVAAVCLALHLPNVVPLDPVERTFNAVLAELETASVHVTSVSLRRSGVRTASVSVLTVLNR